MAFWHQLQKCKYHMSRKFRKKTDHFSKIITVDILVALAELDMFSMRLEYCEEKSIKCLTHDTAFGMRLDAPIPDVNARYGKCKSIFDECLKAQIAQY